MADDGTMRRIWRYKSDLEQEPDEEKLLEILGKLKSLCVSISVLQETGIGKLVNSYRKRAGTVGDLARSVVSSWKAVVEREVTTSKNRSPSPNNSDSSKVDKHSEGEQSDADSWNSFKEKESSRNRNKSEPKRKRKYSTESDEEEMASCSNDIIKHQKVNKIKVEPDGDYTPAPKKKHVTESRDLVKSEKLDGVMKVTTQTIRLKTEHSHERYITSSGLSGDGRSRSNNHNHGVDGKGDRQKEARKVDRKKKQHSISSNEEDDDKQASDCNQRSANPSLSSSHTHSSSSNSHKHSSNSHKHLSSSSSHKHLSSSSSHTPSYSSGSHKHSSGSHKHSSPSSSHKPSSSSSSHRPSPSKSSKHETSAVPWINGSSQTPSSKPLSSSQRDSVRDIPSRKHSMSSGRSHSSPHKGVDEDLPSSQKRHSSCKERPSSSSRSDDRSYNKESELLDDGSYNKESELSDDRSYNKESELSEKLSCSNSSSHLTSHQPGFRVSSSTVRIKEEDPQPHTKECHMSTSPALSSNRTTDKSCTKMKSVSSGYKRNKPKRTFEDQELDLFSEALHIKAEPSSPVSHKSQQTASHPMSSKTQQSHSNNVAIDSNKVKSELKIEHKHGFVKQEKDSDSDSLREHKKSKEQTGKVVKEKKVESQMQDEKSMSFEDFMTFDEATLVSKGKSSSKKLSSKGSNKQIDKPMGSKWSSSLTDPPQSSTTSFSVPPPANNVTVTELDILSMLPETQVNYKPLRFNPYYKDEEKEHSPLPLVDPDIIGTKSVSRTHVYSGRKHGITEIKSLYELSMQVLIDNIDAIDCVGNIPYSILKPVLERCSAQQLYQLEDYNPHFLEDSDELWKILCQRDFKGSKPEELENWRELYMRLFEERELKYQKLKQSMSSSITKGQAGRKAQLAYVDTVAKPPREVLRKQKQFGTGCVVRAKNNPAVMGTSSSVKAYKPSLLVPAYNPMNDRSRVARPMPPMMAKSLQMRKNMRR